MPRSIASLIVLLAALPCAAGTYALEEIVEIPAPEGALFPTLSPDGRQVAFAAPAQRGWDLYVGPVDGAPERVLGGVLADADTWTNSFAVRPWSADGRHLAFLTFEDADGNGRRGRDEALAVQVLDLARRTIRRVSSPGTSGLNPAWGASGQRLCYTEAGTAKGSEVKVVCRAGLDAPPRVLVRYPGAFVYWLVPAPDGRHLALRRVDREDPLPRLLVLDSTTGREVAEVAGRAASAGAVPPRWRADGQVLYFVDLNAQGRPDVLELTVLGGQASPLGAGGCATFLAGPDATHLLLASPRRTLPELERTLDTSVYDLTSRRRRRVEANLNPQCVIGHRLVGVRTDSGRLVRGRLVPRGMPESTDPGTTEALIAETIRRTVARIHEAAAPFAVYRVDHGRYPQGPDPGAVIRGFSGASELPRDALGRPFHYTVLEDGEQLFVTSEPYEGWRVEYSSRTGRAVVTPVQGP